MIGRTSLVPALAGHTSLVSALTGCIFLFVLYYRGFLHFDWAHFLGRGIFLGSMTFLVLCRSSSFSRGVFIRYSPSLEGPLEFQTQTRLDLVTITHNQVHDCSRVRQTSFPSVKHTTLTIRSVEDMVASESILFTL